MSTDATDVCRSNNQSMIDSSLIPLSLYIHWPWCVKKCPYCDFNSHVAQDTDMQELYAKRLIEDLERQQAWANGRKLHSIFIGGGTPNLMRPQTMALLLNEAEKRLGFESDIEITMEANPGAKEERALVDFRATGVNRLSLGVQSFNDEHLKILGRIHSSLDAKRTLEVASQTFDNFNLDLMFGLPYQTMEQLADDLQIAFSFNSTHFSCYQLTIEEGTRFYKQVPDGIPDDDVLSDMTDFIAEQTHKQGFEHYEVSGYAKKNRQCRHNLNYWTYGDYLAIGAGAHGKVTMDGQVYRWSAVNAPKAYIDKSFMQPQVVPMDDRPFEYMLNVLRLYRPVSLTDFVVKTGVPLERIEATLDELKGKGLITVEGDLLHVTDKGHAFLSDVQEAFLD